jgi:hypothetical protein
MPRSPRKLASRHLQSPDGMLGRICVRNSFCREPKLNNCSRKAVCYEEGQAYRCECARGYIGASLAFSVS